MYFGVASRIVMICFFFNFTFEWVTNTANSLRVNKRLHLSHYLRSRKVLGKHRVTKFGMRDKNRVFPDGICKPLPYIS